MKLTNIRTFTGPNQFRSAPTVYIELDLAELENLKAVKLLKPLETFLTGQLFALEKQETVQSWFATNKKQSLAFVFAELYKKIITSVVNSVGQPLSNASIDSFPESGNYKLLFEYTGSEHATLAARLVFKLLQETAAELVPNLYPKHQNFFFRVELNEFKQKVRKLKPNPLRQALKSAAAKRHLPFIELDGALFFAAEKPIPEALQGVLQLAYGCKQKRIKNCLLNKQHFETAMMLQDQRSCYDFLANNSYPYPNLDPHGSQINSFLRARRSAERIGYPVTLRCNIPGQAKLVFTQIENVAQLEKLFQLFNDSGATFMLEKCINGSLYQLLVVYGQVLAGLKFITIQLTGDGRSSISQLVTQFTEQNQTELFLSHDLTLTAVPESGHNLQLLYEYGADQLYEASQLPTQFNQQLQIMALTGAAKLQLPVVAMNFICTDPSMPLKQSGGTVTSFNAEPEFSLYHQIAPTFMPSLAEQVIEALFPKNDIDNIPIVAVTGTNGKTTTSRAIAHILSHSGRITGLACTDGLYIDNRLLQEGTFSGVVGTQLLLSDTELQAAVIEVSRGTLNKKGLGYERSDVGICTNIANDHIGVDGINSLEDMAKVKKVVLDYATDLAIVNADDPLTLKMIAERPLNEICLVSMQADNPAINSLIEQQGRVFIKAETENETQLHYYENGRLSAQFPIKQIPVTLNGLAEHNIQNVAFAIAATLGLGIDPDTIKTALSQFSASPEHTPGRLNFIENYPFQMIIDYAHNVDGLKALTHVANGLEVSGQRILVLVVPGDRRDDDFRECAEAVAGSFDHYICRDTTQQRNREVGAAPALLKSRLLDVGESDAQVQVIINREEAIAEALKLAKTGDLLVFAGSSNPDNIFEQLEKYKLI